MTSGTAVFVAPGSESFDLMVTLMAGAVSLGLIARVVGTTTAIFGAVERTVLAKGSDIDKFIDLGIALLASMARVGLATILIFCMGGGSIIGPWTNPGGNFPRGGGGPGCTLDGERGSTFFSESSANKKRS